METQFITSPDGVRIAYDINGQGPALMLLHGAGKNKQDWHKVGYVKRLESDFTVITVDIRGSGETAEGQREVRQGFFRAGWRESCWRVVRDPRFS